MTFKISKKPAVIATVTAVITFLLLFLSWPTNYEYSVPWSCPTSPDAPPHSIQHCPPGLVGKDKKTVSPALGKAPLIVAVHRSNGSDLPDGLPRMANLEYVLYQTTKIAGVAWLVVYELVDWRGRKRLRARHN